MLATKCTMTISKHGTRLDFDGKLHLADFDKLFSAGFNQMANTPDPSYFFQRGHPVSAEQVEALLGYPVTVAIEN